MPVDPPAIVRDPPPGVSRRCRCESAGPRRSRLRGRPSHFHGGAFPGSAGPDAGHRPHLWQSNPTRDATVDSVGEVRITRAGIHTEEIEVRGDDVAGMAVHIRSRIYGLAGTGDVLVSSTVKELVVGSGIEFTERGDHELRGVPGTWRLYAVDD